MHLRLSFILFLALLLSFGNPTWSAEPGTGNHEIQPEAKTEKPEPPAEAPQEKLAVTKHTVTVDGRQLSYTATAGTLVLKDQDSSPLASIFFVAYTLNGVENPRHRPLTFSFNGGPGSSSVWLHLGALGPRRVAMTNDLEPQGPPYQLEDNPHTLLPATDLVFVDPVSTGYSRAAPGQKPDQFHGVKEDIETMGDFIRLFTTRFQRWPSPKFLLGESYGTTRVAGLTGYLQERHGLYLNGVMLISPVLAFQTISFDPGNDQPYELFLPAYTATAWYHGLLEAGLQEDLQLALRTAEQFARGDYSRALAAGGSLPTEKRDRVIEQMARLTGLSPAYIDRNNLRVNIFRFVKELLARQGRVVGRFDSRLTGIDPDPAAAAMAYDPSYTAIKGIFTATLNHYLRTELQFEEEAPYEILTPDLVHPWDYGESANRYLNVIPTLRQAMVEKPFLKVFVANGYYDLATPYFATRHTIDHLHLDRSLQDNIVAAFYEAGHMMYLHENSLVEFQQDLADFIRTALAGKTGMTAGQRLPAGSGAGAPLQREKAGPGGEPAFSGERR